MQAFLLLSLENFTNGTGVSYQWQSGPSASGPWANVGPNSHIYATSLSATTWYRCLVTCSASTSTSTPVQVTLNPTSACYCVPSYTNGCTFGDFIANVTFQSINNTTVCSPAPFYTYYSAITAPDLIAGGSYPLSVTVGPDTFGQFVGVWGDFNQDGDFNDAGEFLTVPPTNAGANGTVVVNVNVPLTAALGLTRLRIRSGDDVAMTAGQSCGASNSTFGEAEDYNINILPCTPAIITGHPSNASIACGGSTTFTAAAAGNVSSYQWETRGDPTVPQTMTFTNNTPLAVPDGNGAGIYSTINVAGIPPGAIISNVSIRVNIDHTYVGDMENNIIAPNGVSMSLMAELDGGTGSNSSNNFTNSVFSSSSTTPISGVAAPRTGTFAADRLQGYGPSANFQTSANGMPWSSLYTILNGDWKLGLSDWYAGDVGTLNNWSITFTYTAPTAWVNITNGGIYSGATTPTLSLNNVSQAYNGNQYRAVINSICSGVDVTKQLL
ncbi:MAG: proprotein convertase P-domain-containing protein [Chitinophagaceae bacterium]|nr:proprotein convertase P-domain-containing protein [Chitinophagaceae bacterium]